MENMLCLSLAARGRQKLLLLYIFTAIISDTPVESAVTLMNETRAWGRMRREKQDLLEETQTVLSL